jgi:hypothetical protein
MGREARVKREGFKTGEKKAGRDIKVWTTEDLRERVLATPKKRQQVVDIVLPENSEHQMYTIPEEKQAD